MSDEIILQMSEKIENSMEAFRKDLSKVRTGRASLSLLDGVKVDSYGALSPLNQVATLTTPESRLIVIQPWDPQVLPSIEKAILKSNLGLTPASDGKIIRISIPQLTEERRKELVKQVKKTCEDYRINIRNSRREAIDHFKKLKKDKEMSEDDLFKYQDEAQNETDNYIKMIDEALVQKDKEVMEV
ncbi:MAG: ribosome recycling factor [Spirochaetales bacterium]|jgi:ribosome recycling factor|nr:ribosome recycling factor [Spirochaetales bacterium]